MKETREKSGSAFGGRAVKSPDFVVVGHVVEDLTPQGSRIGGTATFAALQAHRLGVSAGIVTRARPDTLSHPQLEHIAIAGRPSDQTTTFENTYDGASRRQRVVKHAASVTEEDVPSDWKNAPIMLVGPMLGEIQTDTGTMSSNTLLGVGAQGWLRELDEHGIVRRRSWTGSPFWRGSHVLFVSDEDLAEGEQQFEHWLEDVPAVVVTQERRGARVHDEGRWREIGAFPADEIDPTGAGDVFSAAYLVRYHETGDVAEATRFAAAAASCSVEAVGVEGIADREQIEARMSAHPEVVLA